MSLLKLLQEQTAEIHDKTSIRETGEPHHYTAAPASPEPVSAESIRRAMRCHGLIPSTGNPLTRHVN